MTVNPKPSYLIDDILLNCDLTTTAAAAFQLTLGQQCLVFTLREPRVQFNAVQRDPPLRVLAQHFLKQVD
jgi:hypothetical protein